MFSCNTNKHTTSKSIKHRSNLNAFKLFIYFSTYKIQRTHNVYSSDYSYAVFTNILKLHLQKVGVV